MDANDQSPVVVLALYAATAFALGLWSGVGLAMYALVLGLGLAAGVSQAPLELAFTVAGAVLGLVRLAGALATAGFAAWAAYRLATGDAHLVRPASLAAAAFAVLSVVGGFLTLDCCTAGMWLVPATFAFVAVALVRSATRDDDAHPGWGGGA